MADIYHKLFIAAPGEKLYNALTTPEGLAAWWTPKVQFLETPDLTLRFGFGNPYFKDMKITISSENGIQWLCVAGAEEWTGTTISIELQEGKTTDFANSNPELQDQLNQANRSIGVVLAFKHTGWKAQTPMFAECNYTWARFLYSLKLYCETGKGRPWPEQHLVNPQS